MCISFPQKQISGALQKILRNEEKHDDNNNKKWSMDEEWFIKMHIDVTQVVLILRKLIRL